LIADVLELLDDIERGLINARSSQDPHDLNVIKVAAHSGVLVSQKYLSLLACCEIYAIAIGRYSPTTIC
jgi:hypothetical protein